MRKIKTAGRQHLNPYNLKNPQNLSKDQGAPQFQDLTSEQQQVLMDAVTTPRNARFAARRGFRNPKGIGDLLREKLGIRPVEGTVSVDQGDEEMGEPALAQVLLEARRFSRILPRDDQQLLHLLFQIVFLEGADAIPERERRLAAWLFPRVFGRATAPLRVVEGEIDDLDPETRRVLQRMSERKEEPEIEFTVDQLIRSYPEIKPFLLRGPLPPELAAVVRESDRESQKVHPQAPLRIAEVLKILQQYRERPENQRPLPETLSFYRTLLRQEPVPRLLELLPDLEELNARWDPFQIELMEDYAWMRVERSSRQVHRKSPPQPPWGQDVGRRGGLSDFPAQLRDDLDRAEGFVQRVLLLARHIGLKDTQLARIAGVNPIVIRGWRKQGTKEPTPGMIPRFAAAVRAHPIFLLTAKPVEKAMQRDAVGGVVDNVGERMRLWLKAKGLSHQKVADELGVHLNTVTGLLVRKKWKRDTLRHWSLTLLGEPPVLLETGWEPVRPLFSGTERAGFRASAPSRAVQQFASELEQALVESWRKNPQVGSKKAADWWAKIRPDPSYRYRGLAVRLLMAHRGTIRRMAHYRMIPREAAQQLLDWSERLHGNAALSKQEIREGAERLARVLALPLARAYEALEVFFRTAPEYRPPAGYQSDRIRRIRIQHGWDLIARCLCLQQILAVANQTDLPPRTLKNRVLLAPSPEDAVRELFSDRRVKTILRTVQGEFPDVRLFTDGLVRNYLATYSGSPAQALREAGRLYPRLVDLGERVWIRPVTQRGDSASVHAFAYLLLSRRVHDARNLLRRFEERNDVLNRFLTELSPKRLRQLADWGAGGLGVRLYDEEVPAQRSYLDELWKRGFLVALDILNRVIAYRQAANRNYLAQATGKTVRPVVKEVLFALEKAQRSQQLPQSADELEQFIQRLAAGLEGGDRGVGRLTEVPQPGRWDLGAQPWWARSYWAQPLAERLEPLGVRLFDGLADVTQVRQGRGGLAPEDLLFRLGTDDRALLAPVSPAQPVTLSDDLTFWIQEGLELPEAWRRWILEGQLRDLPADRGTAEVRLGNARPGDVVFLNPEYAVDRQTWSGMLERLKLHGIRVKQSRLATLTRTDLEIILSILEAAGDELYELLDLDQVELDRQTRLLLYL